MKVQNTNATEVSVKKGGINLKKILSLIFAAVLIGALISNFGGLGGSSAKQAAEDKVKQNVYMSLGIVPTDFKSDVIYRSGDKRLIEVKYGLTSTDWDGSYCVYTSGNYAMSTTQMMGADYDFKEHIEECKALFGLS